MFDMNRPLYIPACRKYLEDENGIMDVQKLFSLSRQAYSLKYPKEFPDHQELLSFLQANNLVPPSYRVEELNTEQVEFCFSIITKYNCNSLCQLCGYSPLYKNQLEEQEAILLGYALSSWKNLQSLIHSGITSRHFRAMISMTEKSKVAVVPLNRLAFEFMEKIPKSQNDMRNLPELITNAIKENNKNKLSTTDAKVAQRYLENLQNSNYQYIKTEVIQRILKKDYKLDFKENPNSNEQTTNNSVYIDGFLGNNTPEKSTARNILQEQPSEKRITQESVKELLPNSVKNNDASTAEEKKTANESTKEKPVPKSPAEKTHTVLEWNLAKTELHNCITVDLDHASKQQYKKFLDCLLVTPILPVETGMLENEPVVFICMNEKLYYFSTLNSVILDDMIPYITQSKFRKIICFEPYRLYSYLYEQQITSATLFSIKIFSDCFDELKQDNNHPKTIIKRLLARENKTSSHDLYFSMSNYQKLYETIDMKYKLPAEYNEKMLFCQLLGFSFIRNRISRTALPLFTEIVDNSYIFTYSVNETLEEPFKPVQIKFAWNDTSDFPVDVLMIKLVAFNFYYKYQVYLLSYAKNTIIFAIHKNKISTVCEIINNVTCSIAEERNKTPINVAVSDLA